MAQIKLRPSETHRHRQPLRRNDGVTIQFWDKCEPFIHNEQAVLIHRPRAVFWFDSPHRPWQNTFIIIDYWCGGTAFDRGQVWYMDYVERDRILCERCEHAAVRAGELTAEQLVGRHVHIGGTRAVRFCCNTEN